MAVFIGTAGNNIASAPGGILFGFAGGNVALLQDAIGDTFVAQGGNDRVTAGNGNDVILGGDGDDLIDGRFGFDVMDGGAGIDTMDVSFFAGNYSWNMATGITNFSAAGEFAFNFENAVTGAGSDNILGTDRDNNIRTNGGNDIVRGFGGNDQIAGGIGADSMDGGTGIDTLDNRGVASNYAVNLATGATNVAGEVALNFENAFTGAGNDSVIGSALSNTIRTGSGNDILNGGFGNDRLAGGLNSDRLTGGLGFDAFIFDTALNAITNVDRIVDFSSPNDVIHLDNAVFTGLPAGPLNPNAFRIGAVALDPTDRIIYNPGTGNLFFDPDGFAGAGQTRFAQVNPGTVMNFTDFFVI